MSQLPNFNAAYPIPMHPPYPYYQYPPPIAAPIIPFNQFSQPPPKIPQNAADAIQAMQDDAWLNQFLYHRNLNATDNKAQHKTPTTTTIPQHQQNLIKLKDFAETLSNVEDRMIWSLLKCTNDEWVALTKDFEDTKTHINNLIEQIEHEKPIITKRILKLRKKRARKKLQREQRKLAAEDALKRRQKIHEQIDQWLNEKNEFNQKKRQEVRETEYKKEMLSDVLKRKSDAKRNLEILSNMVQLRSVRKTAALHSTTEKESLGNDKKFEDQITKQKEIWGQALQQYEEEEQQIKLVLMSMLEPAKQLENEWNNVLFGEELECKKTFNHPMLQAETDLDAFLEIRNSWDSCLSDAADSSAIPLGWIMPNTNPSSEWEKYRLKF